MNKIILSIVTVVAVTGLAWMGVTLATPELDVTSELDATTPWRALSQLP